MSLILLAALLALPGTAPLTLEGDLAARMVDGIHRYLDRATAAAPASRPAPHRERLRRIVGAVDARAKAEMIRLEPVARAAAYRVYAVRWRVFEDVEMEGLLLEPAGAPVARVVAIPDADWTPETLAGAQFARRLAENGCLVLIPTLIDHRDTWSGIPGIRMTNQPHREWIYRMAFEAGRHPIGYEVQAVLAAVDWFESENVKAHAPVAVAGYGEGGLIAFYSAALDERIQAALVSGYFQPREELWKEPIYRNVWSLVREFGDAEIAALVPPRALVIEHCPFPRVTGPPPETRERRGAAPNGAILTPAAEAVRREARRARARLVESASPGSDAALAALLEGTGVKRALRPPARAPRRIGPAPDAAARLHRQFDAWVNHTQRLLRESPKRRQEFWAKPGAPAGAAFYRDYVWDEIIGRLPPPSLPANARSRPIYDHPKFRGWEVMLDVWPDVFAYGILLVPKNLRPGERRPVVVCQHGLEGRPQEMADPASDHRAYHRYAARLAEEGFVVYAPQNPYIGQDRFRLIQRKAHPLKLSLFSFILGQHQRTLEWLAALPFVDGARIGFYGLSYGGKTAVRVPPLLEGYALSICSADFNEWVWKTTRIDSKYSYMITQEYDMLEFDFANKVNYSDLANLMAPRPFMVERGHYDGVAPDEWVAYEFAKTRFFYNRLKLSGLAEMEFFDGPHAIHGKGTFDFLRRHLRWPLTSAPPAPPVAPARR